MKYVTVSTYAALPARAELATAFGDETTPALAETAAELRQRCSEHYRLPDQD